MNKQQQIEQLKTALAAIDNAISQTQAALASSSTTADDVRSLRATLIDLQTQRSQVQTDLINLQASDTEVEPLAAAPPAAAVAETEGLHKQLDASITDRTAVAATIQHAATVRDNASRLRAVIAGAPPTKTKTAR
jgi:chromosome segregation ATPase